jgi:hypothetical protein
LDAVDGIRALVVPWPEGLFAEAEDGELRVFLRRDMLHLDADALHDRLHHWTLTRLARALPAASAGVSFRHARPADPYAESTLDAQEGWLALEPTMAMELAGAAAEQIERFASLVPEFMEVTEKAGRPVGFRSPDVGSVE